MVFYQIAGSVKFKNNDRVNLVLDELNQPGTIEIEVLDDTPEVLEVQFGGGIQASYAWIEQFENKLKSLSEFVLEPVELWTECDCEEYGIKLPA